MLPRLVAICFVVLMAAAAQAADKPSGGITGVYLTTRYPAMTVRTGETTTIDNHGFLQFSCRHIFLQPRSCLSSTCFGSV